MKLTPTKAKIEKKCKPEFLNGDDKEGQFLGRLEHSTAKDHTDITAGFTYGLPKLADGVSLHTEGNLTAHNSYKEVTGDLSAVFGYNNQFYLGTKVGADLKSQKLGEVHGLFGVHHDGNFAYFVSNCLARTMRFGFSTPHVQYLDKLAAEARLELDDKHKLKGDVTSAVALTHKINDDAKIKVKLDISKEVYAHFSLIHRINNNLTLTMTDYCNPMGFFKNSGKEGYKLGVSLEANL